MNILLFKRIRKISLVTILILLAFLPFAILLNNYDLLGLISNLIWMVIIALATNYFIKLKEKMSLRQIRIFSWSTIGSLVFALGFGILAAIMGERGNGFLFISLFLFTVFLYFGVMRLFAYNPSSLAGTITGMVLILIGIFFKNMHWPGTGFILTINCSIMAFGTFATGIASLYWVQNNRFLKYSSFFGGFFLAFAFLGLVFKIMHWPGANYMINATQIPMLVLTLVFILMLPNSGYFNWTRIEKRILARLAIPWVFFLVIIASIFVFPQMKYVFFGGNTPSWNFGMKDYVPEIKNGLEPEFK